MTEGRETLRFAESRTVASADFATVVEHRAQPMLSALADRGSVLLLVGDPGSGKAFMAEYVAREIERIDPGAVHTFVLPGFPDALTDPGSLFRDAEAGVATESERDDWLSETFRAVRVATRIAETAQTIAGDAEPLLVLSGIDEYTGSATAVLEHLVRMRGVRIIGTAHHMRGGASQLARDPRTVRLTVGPLDLEEADAMLSSQLGNGRIAPATLRRWHAATGGNSHALSLMLTANARSGALKYQQGVAYVSPVLEEIPEEFVSYIDESCTEEERRILDMLALTDPMCEGPLLRGLDTKATASLLERNLIATQQAPDGRPALRIRRSILMSAIRARMSPARRLSLADEMFLAITGGDESEEFARRSPDLVRAVDLGLASGRSLPHDWLATAVTHLFGGADSRLMLRVSLALALGHATPDAAAAALRAAAYGLQLGDLDAVAAADRRIDALLADPAAIRDLPGVLRIRLRLSQIERQFGHGAGMADVIDSLGELETRVEAADRASLEAIRGMRFRLLLRDGDFAAAAEARPDDGSVSEEMVVEWMRAPARSASTVLLLQQGVFDEAISTAFRSRSMAVVGRRPLNDTAELQSFHWFLGHWASGSSDGARSALETIEADATDSRTEQFWLSELVELGWAMLALQEARWRDAIGLIDLIVECVPPSDPYGIDPLLSAMRALALAALGDRDAAFALLDRARRKRRGVSQTIAGFRRRIIVQVLQWLQHGEVVLEARSLAEWARAQGLPLIELEALHILAMESRELAREVSPRAREIAIGIAPLVSEAIMSHIEKIAAGASPSDVSEPEVRLLAELGLWIPLPRSAVLSAREREVSLLAALGYSSRLIAERFHLSTRTVETHLAHVYAKLGLADRGELRRWFSADRRVAAGRA